MFKLGLSDFQKVTMFRNHIFLSKSLILFLTAAIKSNNSFRTELDNELLNYDLYKIEYQHFFNIF